MKNTTHHNLSSTTASEHHTLFCLQTSQKCGVRKGLALVDGGREKALSQEPEPRPQGLETWVVSWPGLAAG